MPEILQPTFSIMPYLLVLLALVIVAQFIKAYLEKQRIDKLPYKKTDSIMTPAEQKYFRQLKQEYGQTHFIFPQVKLDKIVNTTDKKKFYTYWNKINKKSIDFVLVDKQTLNTVQLIELNDYTHNSQKRRIRDDFLKQVCKKAGIPLKTV